MFKISKIFKKKLKDNLEQCVLMGLITKEEMLRLKMDRAKKEFDEFVVRVVKQKKA